MKLRTFALAILIVALLPICAYAQTVGFQWDLHPEAASITGFKLYQSRQGGTYGTTPIATFVGGNLTTGQIPKPTPGRWYWVLTAYVADGAGVIESGPSNEVTDVIKPKEPTNFARTAAQAMLRVGSAVASLFVEPKRGLRLEK